MCIVEIKISSASAFYKNYVKAFEYILPALLYKLSVEICSWYYNKDVLVALNLTYIDHTFWSLFHPLDQLITVFEAVIKFYNFVGIITRKVIVAVIVETVEKFFL